MFFELKCEDSHEEIAVVPSPQATIELLPINGWRDFTIRVG